MLKRRGKGSRKHSWLALLMSLCMIVSASGNAELLVHAEGSQTDQILMDQTQTDVLPEDPDGGTAEGQQNPEEQKPSLDIPTDEQEEAVWTQEMEDANAAAGLCEHHPHHTEECGYEAGVVSQPCTHVHTDECYETVTKCVVFPETERVEGNEDGTPKDDIEDEEDPDGDGSEEPGTGDEADGEDQNPSLGLPVIPVPDNSGSGSEPEQESKDTEDADNGEGSGDETEADNSNASGDTEGSTDMAGDSGAQSTGSGAEQNEEPQNGEPQNGEPSESGEDLAFVLDGMTDLRTGTRLVSLGGIGMMLAPGMELDAEVPDGSDADGSDGTDEGGLDTESMVQVGPSVEELKEGHECSEESGCITRVLNCKHVHDDECGYEEGKAGKPCQFDCPLEAEYEYTIEFPESVKALEGEPVEEAGENGEAEESGSESGETDKPQIQPGVMEIPGFMFADDGTEVPGEQEDGGEGSENESEAPPIVIPGDGRIRTDLIDNMAFGEAEETEQVDLLDGVKVVSADGTEADGYEISVYFVGDETYDPEGVEWDGERILTAEKDKLYKAIYVAYSADEPEKYVAAGLRDVVVYGIMTIAEPVADPVAEINGEKYATLQAAIEAVQDGETIVLLDKIDTLDKLGADEIKIEKKVVIDGQKNSIEVKRKKSIIQVVESGDLTLNNITLL